MPCASAPAYSLFSILYLSGSGIGNRNTAAERGTNFAYTANALNQYTNILSGIAPFSPTYDLDGNQTLIRTSTDTWRVTYNGENRPVTWSSGVTNIVMSYDRFPRRIEALTYDNYLPLAPPDPPNPLSPWPPAIPWLLV